MNLIIFGASGATGHHLVRQALAQQHRVTAFVRDPMKLKITDPSLTVVKGDVSNYLAVEQAIKGHDAVLSALGASNPFKYDQAVVDGISNIIKAMELHGVKRFIYLSFLGVSSSRKDAGFFIHYIAPRLLRTEIAGHEAREVLIRQSPLEWTIVQAPKLTNGPQVKIYRSGEGIRTDSIIATSSRADVAEFMLRQLNDTTYNRKATRILP